MNGHDEDIDDVKQNSTQINSQSNELFDDESYIIHKLIRVRRVPLPGGGEDWEILEDKEVAFTLKGIKLTKKEKAVLYTVDGIQLLMNEYKSGNKTISGIRKKIRELCSP